MKRIGEFLKRGTSSPRQGSPSRADQPSGPAVDARASTRTEDQTQAPTAPTAPIVASSSQTELQNTPVVSAPVPKVFPSGIEEWWKPSAGQPTVLEYV
jgi:hypothetical protein